MSAERPLRANVNRRGLPGAAASYRMSALGQKRT